MIGFRRAFFVFLFVFSFFSYAIVHAESFPAVYSDKVIVYDVTEDAFLYQKNSASKASIASITKILSVITAIENIKDLNGNVLITSKMLGAVNKELSTAGLRVGDSVTYKDLLYASLLPSGADATVALAYSISGGIKDYVTLMNKTAKKIGMYDSNFANVTGLDNKNHYSTAEDVLKLLQYSIKNQVFMEAFLTTNYKLSNGLMVKATYLEYLKKRDIDFSKFLGGKTGTTGNAGKCFTGIFKSDDHTFIVVLLNAKNDKNKNYSLEDFIKLMKFVNDNYSYQTLVNAGAVVEKLRIKYAVDDEYIVKAKDDVVKYLPSYYDRSKFKIVYHPKVKLTAFTKYGSEVGVIDYYYDNDRIYSENVFFDKKPSLDYLEIFKDNKFEFVFMLTGFSCVILLITIIKRLFYSSFKRI